MQIKRQLFFLHIYNFLFSLRIADGVWVVFLLSRGFSLAQVGIAVSSKRLLLILKILYRREDPQHGYFYTSKYTGLLREEESMVQEAVFSLQLHRIG